MPQQSRAGEQTKTGVITRPFFVCVEFLSDGVYQIHWGGFAEERVVEAESTEEAVQIAVLLVMGVASVGLDRSCCWSYPDVDEWECVAFSFVASVGSATATFIKWVDRPSVPVGIP